MLPIAQAALVERLKEIGPDLVLDIRANVSKGIHERFDLAVYIAGIYCHTIRGDRTVLFYAESASEQALINALFSATEQIDAEAPVGSRIRKHLEIRKEPEPEAKPTEEDEAIVAELAGE